MGRAEPGEGGHEIDLLVGVGARRQFAGLRGAGDEAEPVAQPLHGRAGGEDRAFERIGALALQLVGDRRQQAMGRADGLLAGVQQHEGAGPDTST